MSGKFEQTDSFVKLEKKTDVNSCVNVESAQHMGRDAGRKAWWEGNVTALGFDQVEVAGRVVLAAFGAMWRASGGPAASVPMATLRRSACRRMVASNGEFVPWSPDIPTNMLETLLSISISYSWNP